MVNKVVYGTEVLMDLTGDSVTPDKLLEGATAHNAAGERIAGAVDLSTKQDKITASGMLKGNGSGGVSAAVAGTDYMQTGNITKQALVASKTTPTQAYAINWTYG